MPARTLTPTRANGHGWHIVGRVVSLLVTMALIALVTAVFVAPRLMGGASLTVLTGSMRPTLQPGDVAVVRGIEPSKVCQEIGIGQIVTFMPNPDDASLVTHRVVAKTVGSFDDGTRCRLITQGDANNAADQPVSPVQVRAVFMYAVPWLGWVRQWASDNPIPVFAIAGVAAVGVLIWDRRRPKTTKTDDVDPDADVQPPPARRAVETPSS